MTNSQLDLSVIDGVSRRTFLRRTGHVTLSGATVALLGGCESMAATRQMTEPSDDVAILNVALHLEYEAINAYQLGAESGLLQKPVLNVAVQFQSHHKEHAEALVATIRKMDGTPVEPRRIAEYADALNADMLKNQTDVLMLAARLEKGAANAYIGVIPAFDDTGLAQVASRLAADEAMHWTVLTSALGQSTPSQALSFGA